jgi:hypothetical protein
MVHALHEAWRVLKPNGLLIDLRPATVHRRVGLLRAGEVQWLGVMRERFDDDRAANRAVAEVVRQGLFKRQGWKRFEFHRTFDNVAEFGAWLDEFMSLGKLPPHDWLLRRLEGAFCAALDTQRGRAKILISAPLDLRVLQKRPRP